jgi:NADH-quinone oxidoreductase E subunit
MLFLEKSIGNLGNFMSSIFKEKAFKQPTHFEFNKKNLEEAQKIITNYPKGKQRSAIMPLLDLAQRQNDNWLSKAAIDYIADFLQMPAINVYEVATFYTMYNMQPIGKHLVQVCRNISCWLRGAEDITRTCKNKLCIDIGETTADNKFTLVEVECLGACVNAPAVQIDDDYYEDLDTVSITKILDCLAQGERPANGSYIGRRSSEPLSLDEDSTSQSIKKNKKEQVRKNRLHRVGV